MATKGQAYHVYFVATTIADGLPASGESLGFQVYHTGGSTGQSGSLSEIGTSGVYWGNVTDTAYPSIGILATGVPATVSCPPVSVAFDDPAVFRADTTAVGLADQAITSAKFASGAITQGAFAADAHELQFIKANTTQLNGTSLQSLDTTGEMIATWGKFFDMPTSFGRTVSEVGGNLIHQTVVQSHSGGSQVMVLQTGSGVADAYVGELIVVRSSDGMTASTHRVTAYDAPSRQVTIDSLPQYPIQANDVAEIYAGVSQVPSLDEIWEDDASLRMTTDSAGDVMRRLNTVTPATGTLSTLTVGDVTTGCGTALDEYDGPTIPEIVAAIDADSILASTMMAFSVGANVGSSASTFTITIPDVGAIPSVNHYPQLLLAFAKSGARNDGVPRIISTLGTDGVVTMETAFPEVPFVGDTGTLVGYYPA